MKQRKYYWQPELTTAVMYWSCTFAVLFMSLILSLENTRPYLVSNIVLVFFFVFVFLGLNRYYKITASGVYVHYFFPFQNGEILFTEIEAVKVGTKSIEVVSSKFSSGSKIYMMTKKQKTAFIDTLEKSTPLTEKIIMDNQLKLGKH